MKPIICELCGSNEFAKTDGFFICQHCGTLYTAEEAKSFMAETAVKQNGQMGAHGMATTDNLLLRAREFESKGDLGAAVDYYNRVLDIEFNNVAAREAISRLDRVITGPNLTVDFRSGNSGSLAGIFIDGKRVDRISGGQAKDFTLPYGTHTIGSAGGAFKCKKPVTVEIKRGVCYVMNIAFKGLVVEFQVRRVE